MNEVFKYYPGACMNPNLHVGPWVHFLKCEKPFFDAIKDGTKTYEVRRDDRQPSYKVGDRLVIREHCSTCNAYTGREVVRRVTHKFTDKESKFDPGIKSGFCVLGIAPFAE